MTGEVSSNRSRKEPVPLGEFAEPSFVRLPEPETLFGERAQRLKALAAGHTLSPYLTFLGEIATIQHQLAATLPLVPPHLIAVPEDITDAAHPPLDRTRFMVNEPVIHAADALFSRLKEVALPAQAQDAIERFLASTPDQKQAALQQVLAEPIPTTEVLAEYGLVSAALQVVFTQMAARLDAQNLHPVGDGACPVCGSPPLTSLLVGWPGAHNTRYCACGLCGTLWNYVRIKCTLCGSTKGIAYQEIEGDAGTIKAETCESCRRYVKILHQLKDPELEPLADDVASLGLDLLVRETGFARGGVNPFLLGY
jgi:FdhE protein